MQAHLRLPLDTHIGNTHRHFYQPPIAAQAQAVVAGVILVGQPAMALWLEAQQAPFIQAKLLARPGGVHPTDLPQVGTPGIVRRQAQKTRGATAFEHGRSSRRGLQMKHIALVVQQAQVLAMTCVGGVLNKLPGQLIELLGNVLPHMRALGHDFACNQAGAELQGRLLIVAKAGQLYSSCGGASRVRANSGGDFCRGGLGEIKRLYGHKGSTLMG